MNISILAAGAGGMYCGSCMRDNALAAALKRQGHQITLIPLYTPLRTEPQTVSIPQVFYGGVNVYLQHVSRLFRWTPRFFDRLLDRPGLLNWAGRWGASTPPEYLSALTMSILQGEEGPALKELRRLLRFLKDDAKPQIVSLPNLMFVGVARLVRQELDVPVVCELAGEDIFLDAMRPKDRERIREVIRSRAGDVNKYVATSAAYADRMAGYLGVPRESIDVVYPGISADYVAPGPKSPRPAGRPPVVGYLARMCEEKGLHQFVDTALRLHQLPGMSDVRFRAAGYVGRGQQDWVDRQYQRAQSAGLNGAMTFHGEVERDRKIDLLDEADVVCVPTVYPESKGIFVLEAMARGTPVVQPEHGSFPELVRLTGGGVLVPPGDPKAAAGAIADLLRDEPRRRSLGEAGRQAVRSAFTDDHMAANMLKVYEGLLSLVPSAA